MTRRDYIYKRKLRDELRRAVMTLAADPTASESISTPNGGSRSVSYSSLASLRGELAAVEAELAEYSRSIISPSGFGVNYMRWC